MFKNYSELVKVSSFYKGWDGYNNSMVITSNKCIKALKEKGIDHAINTVAIKQLSVYDLNALETVLVIGVKIEYQQCFITLTKTGKNVNVKLTGKFTSLDVEYLFTKTMIKKLSTNETEKVNHDFVDALQALYDYLQGVL